MGKEDKFGFLNLIKKSFTVITASLAAIVGTQSKSEPILSSIQNSSIDNIGNYQAHISKSKLVLRKKPNSQGNILFAFQHVSHSSHSSHASHASHYSSNHSSHASHFSSSSNNSSLTYHVLGSRVLDKGTEGTDVLEIQKLLTNLGYSLTQSGYFGDETYKAVVSYQTANFLTINGKVDQQTLNSLQGK
jgi:hypothetical protein